ncbi:unnamed protein product [Victoria cruziana]
MPLAISTNGNSDRELGGFRKAETTAPLTRGIGAEYGQSSESLFSPEQRVLHQLQKSRATANNAAAAY